MTDEHADALAIVIGDTPVFIPYDAIPKLIETLKTARLVYLSRELRASVEAMIAGTPIGLSYAIDWPNTKMVGVGLDVPGYDTPMTCQLYPDKVPAFVKDWVDTIERRGGLDGWLAHLEQMRKGNE